MASVMDNFNPTHPINPYEHTCDIPPYVCVHSGQFHADELLAIAIVDAAYDYRNKHDHLKVVRTRDQAILGVQDGHLNVDVGGMYDGKVNFDHHQREYTGPEWVRQIGDEVTTFRMASVGQLWLRYGMSVVARQMNIADDPNPHISDIDNCREVAWRMAKLLACIDAVDNGQGHLFPGDPGMPNIATVLSAFNVYDGDDGFNLARTFAYEWLLATVLKTIEAVEYESTVYHDLMVHANEKPILTLYKPGPWVGVFVKDPTAFDGYKVVVYMAAPSDWRVQTIPDNVDNPQSMRCPAPSSVRGKRDAELAEMTGIADVTFVHPAGFTGGAKSEEGAVALAKWWVSNS